MIKNYCSVFERFSRWAIFSFLILLLTMSSGFAQRKAAFDQGVLRIKVSEAMAVQLETARIIRSANNTVLTGIQSLDRVNQQYKVTGIKRVFRYAGKFEAKHRQYGLHRWYEIELDKAAPVLEALQLYKSIQHVEKAQPVYTKAIIGSDKKGYGPVLVDPNLLASTLPGASNDPMLGSQWHYNNTGQTSGTPGADISLFQAWGLETGSSTVIIAVTDGGAQVNHPDLAANMWVNEDEIPGNGLDDDNNGYVDDINGYGFGDGTGEIAPDMHGTHTSGTIAAVTNNGVGVAGVAGGSGVGDGVRIMSCAAFGAVGTGGFEDTYVYGADNGAVISQNSWGYTSPGVFDQSVLDAIDYFIAEAGKDADGNQVGPMKGGIVIFAAGNDDSDSQHYPGFYAPTLAVSATNHNDAKAWYSNFGSWVDIAAPGGETMVTQQGVLSTLANNQYGFFQGTSMACPHVSGVAALIVSKFGGPGFTPEMLRGRLVQTVDNIDAADSTFAGLLGSGRVNAFSALQQNDNTPPDAIADLAAEDTKITSITLTWTSPSDPGNGSAVLYDIRYSTSPITADNFEAATPATGPPSPKPAGGAESFTINGLTPGTTYYFAVKAADFFGNLSALSNVLEQATNFAPAIVVSPPSITENLLTAQTSTQSFTISNTGLGPLVFSVVEPNVGSFATATPTEGIVAPGADQLVDVSFNANNLLTGSYHQTLNILTNDPAHDSVDVALTLNVTNNGAPIASLSIDSIDFGTVFQTGHKNVLLLIHNAGSDTLEVTQVDSDQADFTSDFSGSLVVPPFDDGELILTYTASSLGVVIGTISIETTDSENSLLSVSVTGEGVEAPGISVTPASMAASLNTGKKETQTLTIQNTGASDLEYSVSVSTGALASVATVKQVDIAALNRKVQNSSGQKQSSMAKKYPQQLTIKSVGQTDVSYKVLIVSPDDDVTDLATILSASGDVQADIFPKESLPGITLSDLADYDVVITSNNTKWLSSGGVEPSVIGDLLADYIDQGGKVIVNQFAYSYDAWQMAGRFIDEQYGPFTPSTSDELIDISLGTILDASHPVMVDVNALDYSGYVQNVSLAPGASALAQWANGELFVAVNSNVVALNMLPSLGNGGGLSWAGDLPTLYQNAIQWLSGPSFVKVNPKEGIVAPGEQTTLEVTFNASGLDGGVYPASIDIANNVPNSELLSVPAVLTVLGPEFTVSPTALVESLEKNKTSSKIIVLKNNGPDDYTFNVSILGKGVSATSGIKQNTMSEQGRKSSSARTSATPGKRQTAFVGTKIKLNSSEAIANDNKKNTRVARSSATQTDAGQYSTDFESFATGDIDGQEDWFGQFANWTIETENALSGTQHFRGLADGLGQSLAFSPEAGIGTNPISSTTMKLDIQGSGVTWQIIPQANSAGFVNTRVEFSPDGSAMALVSDGAGGGSFLPISASVPTGYFDLTIEVNRASSMFDVYFNDDKVFTGLGFAGDIEQVVVLSLMEEAGPVLDMDDLQILDGPREVIPPTYITVLPTSGNIASGQSVEITVNFNSADLSFGTYRSDINITIVDADRLVVPASLSVIGDPNIHVDPTVLQAQVDYRGETVKTFEIKNTGGAPLTYSMQVIGAATDVNNLPASPISKFKTDDPRIMTKQEKDKRLSKVMDVKPPQAIQLLTGSALLEENFDGANFPPSGWAVADNVGDGVVWNFAGAYEEGNYSGTGEAATASSDAAGYLEFDTELLSPVINTTGYKNITVQYTANYQNFANLDYLDLDISVNDSAWVNVLSWNENHGSFRETPGEFVSIVLDDYLNGASSFRLRWHYYDPNTDDWDWYAQVDNVVVLGNSRAWLSVIPASGTVPVRGTTTIAANFDASDIESGFYVGGVLINSNSVESPLVGLLASLDVLEPAAISVDPDTLYQELATGQSDSQTLTISNSGESVLNFSFGSFVPPPSAGPEKARREPTSFRTQPTATDYKREDYRAIVSPVAKKSSFPLYLTGFEEFASGDIDGQENWEGQFANWTIESINASAGTQHFRGLADGLGQSLAFSPQVAIGTDAISSTMMMLNIDNDGTTWQIIPQSNTAEFVNTRFEFSPDGSMKALVSDGAGGGSYEDVPGTIPTGYFSFAIEVERATAIFRIYINKEEIFTGQGFAGDIEQVVIYSLMETSGPTFDVDDFAILDGAPEVPWLNVNPKVGSVLNRSSMPITVTFNAADLAAGVYFDTLNITSNDPTHSVVRVPVTFKVIDNALPVLHYSDTTVVEKGAIKVTFTATDEDDADVLVTLVDLPDFGSVVSKGNGVATYSFKPKLGDAGDYYLGLIAQDGRGGLDSAVFHLQVLPYGVANFSLINSVTDEVIANFEDSVAVDVAHPDFNNFRIRANTNPTKVGSVQFYIDGHKTNIDNSNPYLIKPLAIQFLEKGDHLLKVTSFTKSYGKGDKGAAKEAVVTMINTSTISSFALIQTNGNALKTLADGDVIDISQPGYNKVTVLANVSSSAVKSVKFYVNNNLFRFDNVSPFVLTSGPAGNYRAWNLLPGNYTLSATPYSKQNGGLAGEPTIIHFTVVAGSPAIAKLNQQDARGVNDEITMEPASNDSKMLLHVYPVPVKDEVLNLKVSGAIEGNVQIVIINAQGQSVYHAIASAESARHYQISLEKLNLSKGVYFVQVTGNNGVREIRKIIKE